MMKSCNFETKAHEENIDSKDHSRILVVKKFILFCLFCRWNSIYSFDSLSIVGWNKCSHITKRYLELASHWWRKHWRIPTTFANLWWKEAKKKTSWQKLKCPKVYYSKSCCIIMIRVAHLPSFKFPRENKKKIMKFPPEKGKKTGIFFST